MKFWIACVLTSFNMSREALPWFWKAMGACETGLLKQNDRTNMFILSRSPRELMLAAASIAVQHLLLHVFFPPLAIFIQTIGKSFLIFQYLFQCQ
jgi:hypothetical protein